jgi:hypothetical protein
VVVNHDFGVESQCSDEGIGAGAELGGQTDEGDPFFVDQSAGSCFGAVSEADCATVQGASVFWLVDGGEAQNRSACAAAIRVTKGLLSSGQGKARGKVCLKQPRGQFKGHLEA